MTNTAEKLTLPLFMVKYNGDLLISTGRSRFETSWKNKTMSWAALLNKLSHSMETTETHAEYMKMSKEQQDKIKDIGGFVGGHLRDGRRQDRPTSRPASCSPSTWTSLRPSSGTISSTTWRSTTPWRSTPHISTPRRSPATV